MQERGGWELLPAQVDARQCEIGPRSRRIFADFFRIGCVHFAVCISQKGKHRHTQTLRHTHTQRCSHTMRISADSPEHLVCNPLPFLTHSLMSPECGSCLCQGWPIPSGCKGMTLGRPCLDEESSQRKPQGNQTATRGCGHQTEQRNFRDCPLHREREIEQKRDREQNKERVQATW